MYAQLRNALFQLIPGYCFSDFIYLGMIVFIISGFIATKKWTPFYTTAIFSGIFELLELLLVPHSNPMIIVSQFLHMIVLPLIITLLYAKRG